MAFLTEAANRGSISTGFDIDNSLSLKAANSEHLYRTMVNGGNRRTWTYSIWFKKSTNLLPNSYCLIHYGVNHHVTRMNISDNDDTIYLDLADTTNNLYQSQTKRRFSDNAAWYHIVWRVDTTQSTAADRSRLYVNGVEETEWTSQQLPPQNLDTMVNTTAGGYDDMAIGTYVWAGSSYDNLFDGYIAQVAHVDGQSYAPTEFGEFDDDSNIWKPKDLSNITWGSSNNSFFLDFEDSSDLGNDSSGNNNDWSLSNVTAVDQATDTPTNNFANLVPAWTGAGGASSTLKNAGTTWDINMPSGSAFNHNTTAMSNFQMSGTNGGKWYIETKITNNNRAHVGILASLNYLQQTSDPTEFVYWDFYNGWIGSSLISTETTPPGCSDGDIIGLAIDCDNQRVTFSKNGGWLVANGDMTGTSPSDWRWDWTSDSTFLDDPKCNGNVAFYCGIATDANVYRPIHQVNFGGFSPYTISSGNSDANGYGNFEYTVPSGFYALCTKNLAEFG